MNIFVQLSVCVGVENTGPPERIMLDKNTDKGKGKLKKSLKLHGH